jgi:hypothetical protein
MGVGFEARAGNTIRGNIFQKGRIVTADYWNELAKLVSLGVFKEVTYATP